MRKKELKLVITFHTTAEAIAFEKICKVQNIEGRLIPTPRTITAGCGLAWCAKSECREAIKEALQKSGIAEEALHECMV